jgi:proton-coupled amino acid transporter
MEETSSLLQAETASPSLSSSSATLPGGSGTYNALPGAAALVAGDPAGGGKPAGEVDVMAAGDNANFHQSLVVSLKSFVGVGLLSLPYSFLHTGLVVGVMGLVFVGFCTWWSMRVLVSVRERIDDENVRTLGDVASRVFGSAGSRVVETALIVTQFGFCCGYIVFASSTLNTLVPALPEYAWTLLIMPMVVSLSWLPSLGRLSWASAAGVAMIIYGVIVVCVYSSIQIATTPFAPRYTFHLASLRTLPVFLGIAVAVWEGVALVLPTRAQMRDTGEYPRVLNYTIVIVGVLYLLTSVLGYMAYGDDLLSIVTLNLPQTGHLVPLMEVAFCVMVIFSYPIQFYPVMETLERSHSFRTLVGVDMSHGLPVLSAGLVGSGQDPTVELKTKAARAALVFSTGAVAMLVPNYGLVVSLVGSLGGATLSLVVPNVLYLALAHRELNYPSIVTCWVIIATGLMVAVVGTTETVYLFIAEFDGKKH